uniref:carbonic anhydrase n=1 Tax=Aureoumbra lagunensis TaxID=44058 RepID=A0A7S3JXH4_9STRA|mmetsp:Transcript_4528/g.6833  ORF Transcript_4528/g.6833 Transcript_4528/m.6833 type:complete len:163 (+) Transcript_4528:3763-4251(+)
MHIVHAENLASPFDGALLVIGILFQLTDEDNPFLESINFKNASSAAGDGVDVNGEVDLSFFEDIYTGEFYRYKGALTVPPCNEIVEWFVMKKTSTISKAQLESHLNTFIGKSNYRPIQPLNGRQLLDTKVALKKNEECVEGADLCGDGLECNENKCKPPTEV